MKFTKSSLALALAAITAIASPCVVAADQSQESESNDSGWYGGFNIGQTSATIDDEKITAGLLAGGLGTASITDDDRDTGFKVFGAYQFNENFALEGGYFDLGEFGFLATTVPPGTLSGTIKATGWNLDAVGILPFTEKFSAFGRLGLNYADVKDSFAGTGAVSVLLPTAKESGASYKIGVGLQYDFTERLGMRAEVERYRLDDAVGNMSDIDLLSLGLVFRFGGKSEPGAAPVAAPVAASCPKAPVAAACPTPPPAVVVVPLAKKTAEYCSILDLTYEINQEEIQNDDKEKLKVLGTFLKKYPDTTAVIEGHADDVGTTRHNLDLSQQRADSVVTYLTDTFKIAPSRLSAVGYGDTRPIADNRTQEGKRANRRIDAVVACATDIEGLTVVPARTTIAMEMEFDPKSAEILPAYRDQLRAVATFMKANPAINASVEGHDSMRGGNAKIIPGDALAVSQRRAQAVVDHLANNLGINRSRLSAEGYGQTRRIAYGTTLENQQENRRVNIIFIYKK